MKRELTPRREAHIVTGKPIMKHAERRLVLLSQHQRIRELIATLGTASADVLASRDEQLKDHAAVLARAIATFSNDLRMHLVAEEELLGPVLERIDAWGLVRDRERLGDARRRAVLDALRTDRKLDARDMAKRARSLAADVLLDMDAEEHDLLSERVLHDDVVSLDQSDS